MSEIAVNRTASWLDEATPSDSAPAPQQWACVEIFGHRKHYGRITEVEKFGAKMLRVDVPLAAAAPLLAEPEKFETFVYGGAAIFSVTPMTEEAARKWSDAGRPKPWQSLARLPPPDDRYDDDDRPI